MNARDVTARKYAVLGRGTSVCSVDTLARTATESRRVDGVRGVSPGLQRKTGALQCECVDSCSYGRRSLWSLLMLNLRCDGRDINGDRCVAYCLTVDFCGAW